MARNLTAKASPKVTDIVRDGIDEGDAFVGWTDQGKIALGRLSMFRIDFPADREAAKALIAAAPTMTYDEFEEAFDKALGDAKAEG